MKKALILIFIMAIMTPFISADDKKGKAIVDEEDYYKSKAKWEKLSDKEKEKIKKVYDNWKELDPEKKMWVIKNHKKLKAMNKKEREELEEVYRDWEKLSPNMKRILEEKYAKWKELSPEKKEKIKKAYEEYNKLSAAEKRELRDKIKEKIKKDSSIKNASQE